MGRRRLLHPEAKTDEVTRIAHEKSALLVETQTWYIVGRFHDRDPATGRMTRFLGKATTYDEAKERARAVLAKDDRNQYEGCWIEWHGQVEIKKRKRFQPVQEEPDIPVERTLLF
jgi:hypothetical protein